MDSYSDDQRKGVTAADLLMHDAAKNDDVAELSRQLSVAVDVDTEFNWYLLRGVAHAAAAAPYDKQELPMIAKFVQNSGEDFALDYCVDEIRKFASQTEDADLFLEQLGEAAVAGYQISRSATSTE